MVKLILAFLVSFVLTALVAAGADEDRERRVRAAVALSSSADAVVESAPAPKEKALPSFAEGYTQALNKSKVLVVYIGCDGAHPIEVLPDCVVAVQKELAPYSKGSIVVAYPFGNQILEHKRLNCPDFATVATVVKEATSKKETVAGAGDKPLGKPLQWDMTVSTKADCCSYCTGECKCANKEYCKTNNCLVATPAAVAEATVPAQLAGYTLFKSADGTYFYQLNSPCLNGNCPKR